MSKRDFFKDIYKDFYEMNLSNQEELIKSIDIDAKSDEFPAIEVKTNSSKENVTTENKIDIVKIIEEIDNLYITEESKDILKRMIEYMKRYEQSEKKQYIPFNVCIYSNNNETIYKIINILSDITKYFSYISKGDIIEFSLYNLEKVEQLEDIYNNKNTVIVLKDIEGLIAGEQIFKDKILNRIYDKNIQFPKQFLNIIVAKEKAKVDQLFDKNEPIKESLFDFEIQSVNPDIQGVYQEVVDRIGDENEELLPDLLEYISRTYPKTSLSFNEYRDKLYQYILFNKKVPEYD